MASSKCWKVTVDIPSGTEMTCFESPERTKPRDKDWIRPIMPIKRQELNHWPSRKSSSWFSKEALRECPLLRGGGTGLSPMAAVTSSTVGRSLTVDSWLEGGGRKNGWLICGSWVEPVADKEKWPQFDHSWKYKYWNMQIMSTKRRPTLSV